jgi:D-3-phosphoglycerate dehydrogenase
MTILIMQPLPAVAIDWLLERRAELFFGYESAEWRSAGDRIRALIYYSVPIDAPLLDELPALEIIGKRGAGIDTIDLDETERRGIRISSVAGANASAVAEHAVTLLLAATRGVVVRDAVVRRGRFGERFDLPLVREINDSRVGLVGAGNIGKRVAAILQHGFGCDIGVYDPYVPDSRTAAMAALRHPSVAALFTWADHVIIAAPRTPESTGMVGLDELELLGSGGTIVIVSRGGIVDESDLAIALEAGLVRAAGIDVYASEPPDPAHPLLGLDHVVFTPHVAGFSDRALDRASLLICQQVWTFLNGGDVPLVGRDQPWL